MSVLRAAYLSSVRHFFILDYLPFIKPAETGPLYRRDIVVSPTVARTGKTLLASECVVGLRGLELRAKHAVAIEPVSRE